MESITVSGIDLEAELVEILKTEVSRELLIEHYGFSREEIECWGNQKLIDECKKWQDADVISFIQKMAKGIK